MAIMCIDIEPKTTVKEKIMEFREKIVQCNQKVDQVQTVMLTGVTQDPVSRTLVCSGLHAAVWGVGLSIAGVSAAKAFLFGGIGLMTAGFIRGFKKTLDQQKEVHAFLKAKLGDAEFDRLMHGVRDNDPDAIVMMQMATAAVVMSK